MIHEFWFVCGHVSDAAQHALKEADCFVYQMSAEPPLVAVALRYEDERDLTFTWSHDADLQIASTGLYLIWRSKSSSEPQYSSVVDTELLTYEEWGTQIDQATVARLADKGWTDDLGELDEAPF